MPISPIGGFIVKRFISLLVALVLLVSTFALPAFAFAAEEITPTPGASEEETEQKRDFAFDTTEDKLGEFVKQFKALVIDTNKGLYVEMNKEFKLNQDWLDNYEGEVKKLFPNINYNTLPKENENVDEQEEDYELSFLLGNETYESHAADGVNAPASKEYKASKHVTLPAALSAAEGYEFVGWLVPVQMDGTALGEGEYYLYRAGDKFAMPEQDVEAIAYWYATKAEEEGEDDGAAATAEGDKLDYNYPVNDVICLEYCTPSDDPRDFKWSRIKATDSLSLQTSGWWMLRYTVIDGESGDITDEDAVLTPYNTDEFHQYMLINEGKAYNWEAFCLKRFAVDTTNPQAALSSSMESAMSDGLTVGKPYTVSTSLDITDSSSTTTTYEVYRYTGANGFDSESATNDGEWKLIYNSAAKDNKFDNDGELYISSSGVITPIASDLTTGNNYRYKIVYSVKDDNGYFGIEKDTDGTAEFHPTLYLGVKLSKEDETTKARMATWKIILYVIAGLSAIGIVVLLVIKPKQAVEGDARVSATGGAEAKGETTADTQPNDTDDAE